MITNQTNLARAIVLSLCLGTVVPLAVGLSGCKRRAPAGLRGQTNLTMPLYGKVVDQDGNPLGGVEFEFQLEAFPEDWSFDRLEEQKNEFTTVHALSDDQGLFKFDITGCTLRMQKAKRAGYRQLEELDGATYSRNGGNSVYTRYISFISSGYQHYKSDQEHPAVFIFVREGAKQVVPLPCQGGFRISGKTVTKNEPAWPFKPSLDDVDWINGQARVNVEVALIFRAVDSDGNPVANLNLHMDVERYCSLEEMRGGAVRPKTRTEFVRLRAKTNESGVARVTAQGFRFVRIYRTHSVAGAIRDDRVHVVDRPRSGPSYYEREFMSREGKIICRFDDANAMILVMAHETATTRSSILPSRGGYDLVAGSWHRMEPSAMESPYPPITWPASLSTRPATPK